MSHDDDEPVSTSTAADRLARRAMEARSQYARDIAEAGKAHGLDIPLKRRPDGELVLLEGKYPEKVPFGMLLTLVSLRREAYIAEGRIDVAHGILERIQEGEEQCWPYDIDGIFEDNADAFRQYADAILEASGAPRIEVDVVV